MRYSAVAAAFALLAAAPSGSRAETCSPARRWTLARGPSAPAGRMSEHLRRAARRCSTLLLPVSAAAHWFGAVYRDENDRPSCHATGSVAIYYLGAGQSPDLDFGREIAAGREETLSSRLIELRWSDPIEASRHSWKDAARAERLGLGGRGAWPVPGPRAANELL